MATLTKAKLTKVAKEFNEVMALDPPIKTGNGVDKLEADIKEASSEVREDDTFSDEVEGFLVELGIREGEAAEEEEEEEDAPTVDDNEGDIEDAEGDTGNWLKGCEVCNVGLVSEIDRQHKEGGLSLNKACKELVKAIEDKFEVSPYTPNALKQRYLYYTGSGGEEQKGKKKTKAEKNPLTAIMAAIKKTVTFLNDIPKTKKFKNSGEGKQLIEDMRQYAVSMMVSFQQLGIDPAKELEKAQKGSSK